MKIQTIRKATQTIKSSDAQSAINNNMLRTLAENQRINSFKRENRTLFEVEILRDDINVMFGLGKGKDFPRVRSIHDAYTELRTSNPELGISEERIRFLIKKQKIPFIKIGNRAYVALETFEPPFDLCLIYDDYLDSREAIIKQEALEEFAKRRKKR